MMSVANILYLLTIADPVKSTFATIMLFGYAGCCSTAVAIGFLWMLFDEEDNEVNVLHRRRLMAKFAMLCLSVGVIFDLMGSLVPSSADIAAIYDSNRAYAIVTNQKVEEISPEAVAIIKSKMERSLKKTETKSKVAKSADDKG